ncbi:MAG: hypothetical protein IKC42_02675 [Alistipes sp.]|nr:hypothetical protein [Alistipes sp.]
MMNIKLRTLSLLVMLFVGTGFVEAKKTIYSTPVTKKFTFTSTPEGAKVYYEGRVICPSTPGEAYISCSGVITPDKKNLEESINQAICDSRLTFTFVRKGYLKREVNIEPTITPVKSTYKFDWVPFVECELQKDPKFE